MADDNLLLNAIQTGANIGNMRVMRQERIMELQSQEALRRVQERHLAAQVDMLTQKTQQEAKDQAEVDTGLKGADLMYQTLTETTPPMIKADGTEETPEEKSQRVRGQVNQWMATKYPKAAEVYANAVNKLGKSALDEATMTLREAQAQRALAQAETAGNKANFKPFVEELNTKNGKKIQVLHTSPNQVHALPNYTEGKQIADEILDDNGNLVSYVVPGANGPRFFPAKTAQPGAAAKAEIKSIYAKITRLEEKSEGMKDTSFSIAHPLTGVPNTEKAALEKQIADLKAQAAKLDVSVSGGAKKTAATAPSGQRVKVRSKNDGKEYTVPVEQLDEAIQQGYEKVAE